MDDDIDDDDDDDVLSCDNDITMLIVMLKLIIDDIDRLITIHFIFFLFREVGN